MADETRAPSKTVPTDEAARGTGTAEDRLARAYALTGPRDVKALYRDWAASYDEEVGRALGFMAPALTAHLLAERIADLGATPILDVGCGTGLAGEFLVRAGARRITGLDLSRDMLTHAARRGCYEALVEHDVTQPLPFADGTFGAAIATGLFTIGHVDATPLPELVRALEGGGWFAASIHRDVFASGGFEGFLTDAGARGELEDLEIVPAPLFDGQGDTGRYVLCRRTA